MKKVMIVEDESLVALEIENYIQELGYDPCCSVSNAVAALESVEHNSIDLILMDVQIKGDIDGISCAEMIGATKKIPLIYISAFSDDITLERAILTEPSAYLTKPFNRRELKVAMSIATKKKNQKFRTGDVVFDDEFSFDTQDRELLMLGEVVHLSKQERELLALLVEAKNSIVDIYELENELWPNKESNENTRRALIARVRAKLKYKFLETIHSVGYRLSI